MSAIPGALSAAFADRFLDIPALPPLRSQLPPGLWGPRSKSAALVRVR